MRTRLPFALVSVLFAAAPVAANDVPAVTPDAASAAALAPEPTAAAVPAADPGPASGSVAPGDEAALKAVFEASADDALMGTAMDDHAKHLLALAEQWGDAPFAEVLGTCTPEAITSTQGLLDFAGASRSKYRKTFAVEP